MTRIGLKTSSNQTNLVRVSFFSIKNKKDGKVKSIILFIHVGSIATSNQIKIHNKQTLRGIANWLGLGFAPQMSPI
jgi:hypothetical protein